MQLPHDDHEDVEPAAWSAHMWLFAVLSDDFEDTTETDVAWFDRVERLIDTSAPAVAAELRACLAPLLSEYSGHSQVERRRLRNLTRGVSPDAPPFGDVPPGELGEAVLGVLRAIIRYSQSLEGPPPG